MRSLHPLRAARAAGWTAVLLTTAWGCTGQPDMTAPQDPGLQAASRDESDPALLDMLLNTLDAVWRTVASEPVDPGVIKTVTGSRYSVAFRLDSLLQPITLTIEERSQDVVDVQLGPDGTRFETPVVVTFDYAGTANDPAMPNFHGFPPRVFWFNPSTEEWVAVPGEDDAKNKTYRVELKHFSRYAMTDGTGGWEDAPEMPEDPARRDKVSEHE